jgi:hypothetical protein
MRVAFIASPTALHQTSTAEALMEGMRTTKDEAVLYGSHTQAEQEIFTPKDIDAICCWGWRNGRMWWSRGFDVLVMERGYLENRFIWTSLGWNGLNGRAVWPQVSDGGARWREHFARKMQPWRAPKSDGYALILGQVPTDTACQHVDYHNWVNMISMQLMLRVETRFRPHPKALGLRAPVKSTPRDNTLEQDLAGASFCVTLNSNSGVDAVMAGVPTITLDEGSMAWEVTAHGLTEPLITPDREMWGTKIAHRQWLPSEMRDGSAWLAARNAKPGRRQHARAS